MAGDPRLPTRGHLPDALPEECPAGPSIALALQEFQPLDLAFGDAVAPLEGEPRDDGPQVVLQAPRERRHRWRPSGRAGAALRCPPAAPQAWGSDAVPGTWACWGPEQWAA
jgi:hypothetical protein